MSYLRTTIYIIIGFVLGVAAFMYMFSMNDHNLAVGRVLFSALFVVSLILAALQFSYVREWNKKDAANKALYISKDKISALMDTLSSHFPAREMMRNRYIITIEEIHNMMGVFIEKSKDDENNILYQFVYHVKIEPNDIESYKQIEEYKDKIHNKNGNFIKTFNEKADGKEVERALNSLLNEYEFISLSTRKGIFDKETVIDLIGPNIALTFYIFQNYIRHLRVDSRHGGSPDNEKNHSYEEFEKFTKEIINYKNNKFKLEKITYEKLDKEKYEKKYQVPFRLSPCELK